MYFSRSSALAYEVISVAFSPESGFVFVFGFCSGIWGMYCFFSWSFMIVKKIRVGNRVNREVWDELGNYSDEEIDGEATCNAEV